MAIHPLLLLLLLTFLALQPLFAVASAAANSNLFREYIGAEFKNVKFSHVPINQHVQFHFILSFAIDYNDSSSPTNGKFNVFWDSANLTPAKVSSIKNKHPNVKMALSIRGDSVGNSSTFFTPSSVDFSPLKSNHHVKQTVSAISVLVTAKQTVSILFFSIKASYNVSSASRF